MKRKPGCYLLMGLLALMLVGGCAFLQSTQDFVCKPTDTQKQDAEKMLAALDAVQVAAGMFFPAANIVKASSVLKVIQSGGCFLISELQEVFNILDTVQTVKMKSMKMAVPTKFETYPSLRKMLRG